MHRFNCLSLPLLPLFSDSLTLSLLHPLTVPPTSAESVTVPLSHFNWFQAAVLGIVQGLTEFLPISSTAHLKVVPVALGWGDPGVAFTAIIQLGSIAAVLWYFWEDLSQIFRGMVKAVVTGNYKSQEFRLAVGIALGTIPIIIGGACLKLLVPDLDNSPLRSLAAIAVASIVMALLLALAERLGTHKRNFEKIRKRDGILMGLAQALALIPGVSRSGSTLTAGLFLNLERSTAARFSFVLGIPAITLAGLVEFKDVLGEKFDSSAWFSLLIGLIFATASSYLAIRWLISYLKKHSTWVFVWYRLAFGVAILLSLALMKK